jgi:Alpha-tubulin suppressor and related RCC1 domain-containing proteins
MAGTAHAARIVDVDSSADFLVDDTGHVWRWDGIVVASDGSVTVSEPYVINDISDVRQTVNCEPIRYVLKNDGTVWALDNYFFFNNGSGGYKRLDSPIQLSGLSNISGISGMDSSMIALRDDGSLLGMGDNNYGQLGTDKNYGTSPPKPMITEPIPLLGLQDVTAVSVGDLHVAAITDDGHVWTWGTNHHGQLGRPINFSIQDYQFQPFQVPGISNAVMVSAGRDFTLALLNDGTVWAWGRNSEGELGNGKPLNTEFSNTTAGRVKGLEDVTAISAGSWYSLALKSDGTVWAWGKNDWAQLGDGTTEFRNIPVQVKGLKDIVEISASIFDRSLAIDRYGNVWAWGVGHIRARPGERADKYIQSAISPVLILSGDNSTVQPTVSPSPGTDVGTPTPSREATATPLPSGSPTPGMGFGTILTAAAAMIGAYAIIDRRRKKR